MGRNHQLVKYVSSINECFILSDKDCRQNFNAAQDVFFDKNKQTNCRINSYFHLLKVALKVYMSGGLDEID